MGYYPWCRTHDTVCGQLVRDCGFEPAHRCSSMPHQSVISSSHSPSVLPLYYQSSQILWSWLNDHLSSCKMSKDVHIPLRNYLRKIVKILFWSASFLHHNIYNLLPTDLKRPSITFHLKSQDPLLIPLLQSPCFACTQYVLMYLILFITSWNTNEWLHPVNVCLFCFRVSVRESSLYFYVSSAAAVNVTFWHAASSTESRFLAGRLPAVFAQ